MSIMRCSRCERLIDTDFHDFCFKLDMCMDCRDEISEAKENDDG